jgi:hypothetical protein
LPLTRPPVSLANGLDRQDRLRRRLHQSHLLSRQIAHRSAAPSDKRTPAAPRQPQQVRRVPRVAVIVAVLQPQRMWHRHSAIGYEAPLAFEASKTP